jgi:hypothetical protein
VVLLEGATLMKNKSVYWDDERKALYWIDWFETSNSDIPNRHYLPGPLPATAMPRSLSEAAVKMCIEETVPMKPYSVLLLLPDYAVSDFGQETYLAHVEGESPKWALDAARYAAVDAIGGEPDDYFCLLCVDGYVSDHSDGQGAVA